jgi:hypothetical protein
MSTEIKKLASRIDLIRDIAIFCGLIASSYWSVICFVKPEIFHPVKSLMLPFFESIYKGFSFNAHNASEDVRFPKLLAFNDGNSIQQVLMILCAGWVCIVTGFLTVSIINKIHSYFKNKYLINRYGKEEYKLYMRVIEEKEKKKNEQKLLEEASKAHYEKWKEYYKSDMPYDEWKEKVINPFNRQ